MSQVMYIGKQVVGVHNKSARNCCFHSTFGRQHGPQKSPPVAHHWIQRNMIL